MCRVRLPATHQCHDQVAFVVLFSSNFSSDWKFYFWLPRLHSRKPGETKIGFNQSRRHKAVNLWQSHVIKSSDYSPSPALTPITHSTDPAAHSNFCIVLERYNRCFNVHFSRSSGSRLWCMNGMRRHEDNVGLHANLSRMPTCYPCENEVYSNILDQFTHGGHFTSIV